MRLISQFYERVEFVSENNRNMFSPIRFWYDTTENKKGFHKMYMTLRGEELKEILEKSGHYFNPSEQIDFDTLKKMSENEELYLHPLN